MGKFLAILIAIIIAIAAYVYLNPDVQEKLPESIKEKITGTPSSTTAYKWRNAEGVWQYTHEPPPEGTQYEKIEITNDTNVLPVPPQLQKEK